jgi:hypothetical protein
MPGDCSSRVFIRVQLHSGLNRQIQDMEGSRLNRDMIEVKSRVFGLQLDQTLSEQSGYRNECKRWRHLSRNEYSAEKCCAVMQPLSAISEDCRDRRRRLAEQESRQYGEETGYKEDSCIRGDGHANPLVRVPKEWQQISGAVPSRSSAETRPHKAMTKLSVRY